MRPRRDFSCRLLRENRSSESLTRILFIDTESRARSRPGEQHHKLRLAWTCFASRRSTTDDWSEDWRLWYDGEELWSYAERLAWDRKPLVVVGHNVFFDLTVSGFFTYFKRRGWARTFWYDKGLTYLFCIGKERRSIKTVSSTNWFPASLREMGKAVGLPKLGVDFGKVGDAELAVYCFRDVEILVDYVLRYIAFVARDDLGAFRLTRASQALAAYRHRFMQTKVYLHAESDVQALESAAYYGGRTEAFRLGRIGSGPFLSLDVNSMYPFCMRSFPVPTKLRDYTESPSMNRVRSYLGSFLLVAEVDLETDVPIYAVKREHKVLFPVGRIRTFLTTPSFREAVERGHLRKVHRIALYDGAVVFRSYVDHFYSARMEARRLGDPLMDSFAKYMLNSLYGKFGQYLHAEERIPDPCEDEYLRYEIYDATTGEREVRTVCMNVETIQGEQCYSEKSFYAIPAHVTDYARMILWKIIESVGYGRVLYCDTDSIKLRKRDLARVTHDMHPTKLGALKVERESPTLSIFGLKDYAEGSLVHIKGVPRSAIEVSPGVYRFTGWLRQGSHLRRASPDRYITVDMTRTLKRRYDKGNVGRDGAVSPFRYTDF